MEAESNHSGAGTPSEQTAAVPVTELKGETSYGLHGEILKKFNGRYDDDSSRGSRRVEMLCGQRICPRCSAEAYKEGRWGDPDSYKMAAAAAIFFSEKFEIEHSEEASHWVKNMSETGCSNFLMMIAKVFPMGLDKGISHYGVVAVPREKLVVSVKMAGYLKCYVQTRWNAQPCLL